MATNYRWWNRMWHVTCASCHNKLEHPNGHWTEMQATHLEKRKLNQLAPISRLYPEIFSTIFCHVRDSTIRPFPLVWTWGRTKDCIGLTHVCHAWRDIAINTPTLWAKIFISVEDHLEWVQEMLRRSKQCSLSILVYDQSSLKAVDPILHGLKNNMHRFSELTLLNITNHDLYNFFLNSHTHRLESLRISPHCIHSDDPSVARFTLSDNFLRVDSLRYLSIDHCSLDFQSALLHSLTHLELVDIDKDCRLSCMEFVAILATIPGLERLRLEGFLKVDEGEDVEAYVTRASKTHLHIKYLDLSCRILGEMEQFLCTLVLPSSCELRLRISHEGPEIPPGFQLITSWLSRHFQSAPSLHSFRSHLRRWGETCYVASDLQVTGSYDSELEPEGSHLGEQLSASVLLFHDSQSDRDTKLTDDIRRSFLKSLPLSDIVSLEVVDESVTLPDSVWVEVFAPLTSLKTIIINSNHYAAFFRIASPDSSNSIAFPFPALSFVTVKAHHVEDYLSITSSLDSRLEAGLALINLVFYTDNIKPDAIAQLRKSALSVQVHPLSSSLLVHWFDLQCIIYS